MIAVDIAWARAGAPIPLDFTTHDGHVARIEDRVVQVDVGAFVEGIQLLVGVLCVRIAALHPSRHVRVRRTVLDLEYAARVSKASSSGSAAYSA